MPSRPDRDRGHLSAAPPDPTPEQASTAIARSGDPAGIWIAASKVLGRPVSVHDPYPHICRRSRSRHAVEPKACAACAEERFYNREVRRRAADALRDAS